MITRVHTMFYSSEAVTVREYIRDKLRFLFTDTDGGWLIFNLPDAELGCHPTDPPGKSGKSAGTQDIACICDDIHKTVSELKARGVELLDPVADQVGNRGPETLCELLSHIPDSARRTIC